MPDPISDFVACATGYTACRPRARSDLGLTILRRRADRGVYFDAHPIEHMSHDMNDQPLSLGNGAPLRLRNEIKLGFKQVNWIKGWSSSPTTLDSEAATAATTRTTNSSATGSPSETAAGRGRDEALASTDG